MKSMFNSHDGIFGKADEEVRADAAAEQPQSADDDFLVMPCREHPFGITKREAERGKAAPMVNVTGSQLLANKCILNDVQANTALKPSQLGGDASLSGAVAVGRAGQLGGVISAPKWTIRNETIGDLIERKLSVLRREIDKMEDIKAQFQSKNALDLPYTILDPMNF